MSGGEKPNRENEQREIKSAGNDSEDMERWLENETGGAAQCQQHVPSTNQNSTTNRAELAPAVAAKPNRRAMREQEIQSQLAPPSGKGKSSSACSRGGKKPEAGNWKSWHGKKSSSGNPVGQRRCGNPKSRWHALGSWRKPNLQQPRTQRSSES
jgi:hypothetical protein